GQVDLAIEQRLFKFRRENAFAADLWQRLIQDAIPLCDEEFQADFDPRIQGAQAICYVLGLPGSQLALPRANDDALSHHHASESTRRSKSSSRMLAYSSAGRSTDCSLSLSVGLCNSLLIRR